MTNQSNDQTTVAGSVPSVDQTTGEPATSPDPSDSPGAATTGTTPSAPTTELPTSDGDKLQALWDDYLVRQGIVQAPTT